MTGVELALAIVPLVIALVEHHGTVIRKSMALIMQKARNEQQLDFYNELHDELSLLKITLDNIKARSLVEGPYVSQTDSIARVLRCNAPHFDEILNRIMKSIDDLMSDKSIDLKPDQKMPDAMLSKLQKFKKAVEKDDVPGDVFSRIRFTKNEKSRTVALHRIQNGTLKLERMLGTSTELFDQQSRAQKRTPGSRARRYSEALYRKLASKWPRVCSCPTPTRYMARLALWNCCCANDKNGSDDSIDMVVGMVSGERSDPRWHESAIHVKEGARDPGDRQVRFEQPRLSPKRDIEAEPFCGILKEAQATGSKLEVLFEDGKLYQKQSSRLCLRIEDQEDIPLKNLLQGGPQAWDLKEKTVLAVVLAHAALHCSQGPWLRADWSKEHVSFFRKAKSDEPDLGRPYLTVDFGDQSEALEANTNIFLPPTNPALLSLGILLLEIEQGKKIESHWSPYDLTPSGLPNDNTNLTTALRLLENSEGRTYIGYRKAVKACLEWDTVHSGSDNADLSRRMYEAVVEPLEKELEHGFHLLPEHLGLMGIKQ